MIRNMIIFGSIDIYELSFFLTYKTAAMTTTIPIAAMKIFGSMTSPP